MGELFIHSLIHLLFFFSFFFKEDGIYTYICQPTPVCIQVEKGNPSHPQTLHKRSPQVEKKRKEKKNKKKKRKLNTYNITNHIIPKMLLNRILHGLHIPTRHPTMRQMDSAHDLFNRQNIRINRVRSHSRVMVASFDFGQDRETIEDVFDFAAGEIAAAVVAHDVADYVAHFIFFFSIYFVIVIVNSGVGWGG